MILKLVKGTSCRVLSIIILPINKPESSRFAVVRFCSHSYIELHSTQSYYTIIYQVEIDLEEVVNQFSTKHTRRLDNPDRGISPSSYPKNCKSDSTRGVVTYHFILYIIVKSSL